MELTVTAGPDTRALVERKTVKSELGLGTDNRYDSKIDGLIETVSIAFSGADGLRREPWRQTYLERLAGRGGIFLPLGRWPVESVTEVLEDGVTVAAADYSVSGVERSALYRPDGWLLSKTDWRQYPTAGDADLDYAVTYTAGWLLPGAVGKWSATKAYAAGDWVRATSLTEVLLFEATTAGTSGATEPTWPAEGATVTDGTAVWTARAAQELPADVETAALLQVTDWFRGGLNIPVGILKKRTGDISVEYDRDVLAGGAVLAPLARNVLRGYR